MPFTSDSFWFRISHIFGCALSGAIEWDGPWTPDLRPSAPAYGNVAVLARTLAAGFNFWLS